MFHEMKSVYEVYKERSFSKAAKKLFVSQPALSATVKKAEEELGCQIFDRSTIPLTVTREGEYYIQQVEQILQLEDNVRHYYQDIQDLKTGRLAIGSSSYFCAYILPAIIGRFKTLYPKIDIQLTEGGVEELRRKLQEGELDLIMETAVDVEDQSIRRYRVSSEHIILSIPSKYPVNKVLQPYALTHEQMKNRAYALKSTPTVPLSLLKDTPFILLKEGNNMYSRAMQMCRNVGFTPNCVMQLDQIMTAYFIAQTGLGATFIRGSLYRHAPHSDGLCYYKIADSLAQRPIYMVSHQNRYTTRAATRFLELMGAEKAN